jgi:hypothetical protein
MRALLDVNVGGLLRRQFPGSDECRPQDWRVLEYLAAADITTVEWCQNLLIRMIQ